MIEPFSEIAPIRSATPLRPDAAAGSVVLLHGLGRTSLSMLACEVRLRSEGWHVVSRSYPSRKKAIADLVPHVADAVDDCIEGPIHFVTHSMGGILLRSYLDAQRPDHLGRTVMLAPPNAGSAIVDRLAPFRFYGALNGPAGLELRTGAGGITAHLGAADFEVGIVAGTRTVLDPVLSRLLVGRNDGKVTVESTKVEGMADHIEIGVTHTLMPASKAVLDLVVRFLRTGAFRDVGRA